VEALVSGTAEASFEEFRQRARDWLAMEAPRRGWVRNEPGRVRRSGQAAEVARARECQRLLFEGGFAGISWPPEYGGQGLGIREQIAFNVESLEYELPLGLYIIGLGMCGPTILAVGTEEQKRRYIPPMLSGEEVWCQLFSEPGAGSDVAGLSTRAVLDGEEWVVNGQKIWTSGAHNSDFGILLARTDPDVPKHRGMTMFVVDLRSAGVTMRPIHQIDGGAHFNEVFFDDVRIPVADVLGGVGQGWHAATTTLANERVSLGAVRAMDDAPSADALITRARDLGRATDRVVRQELARLWIAERTVGLLGERITSAILRGATPGPEGSVAKLVRTDHARASARLGAAMAGPTATAWAPGSAAGIWASTLLFVPSLSIAGGTDEVLRNIVGERVLGLPREPQVDRDVPFRELAKGAAK
jgi:alkylation response protein AidB-like acyl-CoA dehydrogenase